MKKSLRGGQAVSAGGRSEAYRRSTGAIVVPMEGQGLSPLKIVPEGGGPEGVDSASAQAQALAPDPTWTGPGPDLDRTWTGPGPDRTRTRTRTSGLDLVAAVRG